MLLRWLVAVMAAGVMFAQPVPTLDPWNFQQLNIPTTGIAGLTLHPDDDNLLFVAATDGLFVTRDGGRTWTHPLTAYVLGHAIAVDPTNHDRIFAGSQSRLFVSQDRGVTWTMLRQFTDFIASVLVSARDGSVYVAPSNSTSVGGVFKSTDHGLTFTPHSFNYSHSNLICWHMLEAPATGAIFVGIEIADHPAPYRPPLFRSLDGGVTWQDVSGVIPWHVLKLQVDPSNQNVYALTENAGLFRSTDNGANWQLLNTYFSLDLLIDPSRAERIYGGGHSAYSPGGVWASSDRGASFAQIGLNGRIAGALALGKSSNALYVGAGAGLFVANFAAKLNVASLAASPGDDVSLNCAGCSLVSASLNFNGQQLPSTLTSTALKFTIPPGTPTGQYPATLTISSMILNFTIVVPAIPTAVISTTSTVLFTQKDAYAPGEVISVFGKRFTPATDTYGPDNVAASVPWGTQLFSARVLVDGTPAPIQFAFTASVNSASQINLQLPYSLAVGPHTLAVQRLSSTGSPEATSTPVSFTVKAISPTYFGNDALPIYLQNITQDPAGATFVSQDKPMHPNDVITVYATGLGATNPAVSAGNVSAQTAFVTAPMSVFFSTQRGTTQILGAQFFGAALSPQFPGLYQLSFRVPFNAVPAADGTIVLYIAINNLGSQNFTTYFSRP